MSERESEGENERLQQYTILIIFRVLFVTDVLIAVVYMTIADPTVNAAHGDAQYEWKYTHCALLIDWLAGRLACILILFAYTLKRIKDTLSV